MSKIAVITTRCDALLPSGEVCQREVEETGNEHQVIVLNDSTYEMDLCGAHEAALHEALGFFLHGVTFMKPDAKDRASRPARSGKYKADDKPCPYCSPEDGRVYARLGQHIAKMHPEQRRGR